MEYHAVVWRIFGPGHSPFTKRSTYELIEPVVNKQVSESKRGDAIAEISSWFTADHKMLVPESEEMVAAVIVKGVGDILKGTTVDHEAKTAAWAVGSIDSERATRLVGSCWSADQIDSFVDVALFELKRLAEQDEIFDPDRSASYFGADRRTKMTVDATKLDRRLETFRHLDGHGALVSCVRREATNLIRLALAIRPACFRAMIERLGHPVLQACAAHHAVYGRHEIDYDKPLSWISGESCTALIALAIVHTLNAVNRMEADTDRRDDDAGLGAKASRLLTGLVERLGTLDPVVCVRWIGELLSTAPYVLHQRSGDGIPHSVSQIETACIALVARLAGEKWSDEMITAFSAGLRTNRQTAWTRHLAELAWKMSDTMPARSSEIARAALKEYEDHVSDLMSGGRSLHVIWRSWEHREWMLGLGCALALSCKGLKLLEWVQGRCRGLPLSVWDAEEDYQSFHDAGTVAGYWFLIAFLAIEALRELGRAVDPPEVLELTDYLWTHEDFMNQHTYRVEENEVVAEHAARYAVEFGEPSDTWLLDSMRHPGVSPRALWAMIDQRIRRNDRVSAADGQLNTIITAEILDIASERFGDGGNYSIDELKSWGQLWLLLDAIDEAEKTAVAMAVFGRTLDHGEKLMVLKLLALVASKRAVTNDIERYIQHLYRDLWPSSYTPDEERDDRSLIDKQLSS